MTLISQLHENYYSAVFDTDRDTALQIVDNAISDGILPEEMVFDVVLPTLDRMVRALAESDEATLSQHFIAAKVSGEIVEKLIPKFATQPTASGTVVIGTASGDFHGLGKKIVAGCLTANMFTVHDIGMNVAPKKFIDEAVRTNASVIGVSSMMMHTATGENGPSAVKAGLIARGLQNKIQLIVGGAPYRFDKTLYQKVNADTWAEDALSSVNIIKEMLESDHA